MKDKIIKSADLALMLASGLTLSSCAAQKEARLTYKTPVTSERRGSRQALWAPAEHKEPRNKTGNTKQI